MIGDGTLAQIAARTYIPVASWDRVLFSPAEDDVWAGLMHIDGQLIVAFRGSLTLQDWYRDLCAMPTHAVVDHFDIGQVHAGFFEGLPALFEQLLPLVGTAPVVLTGHSLGAARALLMSGLLAAAGANVAECVAFGAPRPGYAKLTSVLERVRPRIYRNRADPVCEVPMSLALVPFVHPAPLIPIDVAPRYEDPLGPLAVHRSELYAKAFAGG